MRKNERQGIETTMSNEKNRLTKMRGGNLMNKRKFLILMSLLVMIAVVPWGVDRGWAQNSGNGNGNIKDKYYKDHGKVAPSEQKAAAKCRSPWSSTGAAALAVQPTLAGTA
jgi:hypothetical protein